MAVDLKELKQLLILCRKQGVLELKHGDIFIKLGDLPQERSVNTTQQNEIPSEDPWANFPDGELTPEQLAFYSSGGKPEEDPFREDAQ